MKKISKLICSLVVALSLLPMNVMASEEQPLLQKAHATAYCQTGTMASGQQTRDGVCAGAKEYLGCVIVVYQRLPDGSVGDYLGMWECLDTGGTDGLKNGTVVDIWQQDLESCQDFMDLVYEDGCQGKVYIQVIKGKG